MSPTDEELVDRAVRGNEESVAELCERYFAPVYDFCIRLLGKAEVAARAAEETFRRALTSLSDLAEGEAFKAQLFSTALDVALEQRLKVERLIEEAESPQFGQVNPERLSDPGQAPLAQDVAGLVWEGASKLDARDYALLDLHLRHDLNEAEIAAALNTSRRAAQGRLDRLKRTTERSLLSFIMARRGSRSCEGLRRLLLRLPIGATREQVQMATERHLRSCRICTTAQQGMVPPLEVFRALAAVPLPVGLRESIRQHAIEAWRAGTAGPREPMPPPGAPPPIGAAIGDGRRGGKGPLTSAVGALGDGWHRLASATRLQRNLILPLGVALIILAAAGGIAWGTGVFDSSGGGTAIASPTPTGTPIPTSTPAVFAIVSVTPTASATPSPTVAAAPTAPTSVPPSATPAPPTETPVFPTSTPTLEIAPSPTSTPSLVPIPSATPAPTSTPIPTRRHPDYRE